MSALGQQKRGSGGSAPAGRTQPANSGPGAPKTAGMLKMPPGRTWLWFVLILLVNFLLVRFFMPGPDAPLTVSYTFFKEQVTKGNVHAIYSRGETLTGRFTAPVTYPPPDEKSAATKDAPEKSNVRSAAAS